MAESNEEGKKSGINVLISLELLSTNDGRSEEKMMGNFFNYIKFAFFLCSRCHPMGPLAPFQTFFSHFFRRDTKRPSVDDLLRSFNDEKHLNKMLSLPKKKSDSSGDSFKLSRLIQSLSTLRSGKKCERRLKR